MRSHDFADGQVNEVHHFAYQAMCDIHGPGTHGSSRLHCIRFREISNWIRHFSACQLNTYCPHKSNFQSEMKAFCILQSDKKFVLFSLVAHAWPVTASSRLFNSTNAPEFLGLAFIVICVASKLQQASSSILSFWVDDTRCTHLTAPCKPQPCKLKSLNDNCWQSWVECDDSSYKHSLYSFFVRIWWRLLTFFKANRAPFCCHHLYAPTIYLLFADKMCDLEWQMLPILRLSSFVKSCSSACTYKIRWY